MFDHISTHRPQPQRWQALFVILLLMLASMLLPAWPARAAGAIIYVQPGATGNGSSWASPRDLAPALAAAISGDQIWVAAGTYTPGALRTNSFALKSGVAIYGGFNGTETQLAQRNWKVNLVTLSGEIGAAGNTDNSYHIVIGATGATLDGVTISGSNANGSTPDDRGGGISDTNSSPTLTNVIISGNFAFHGSGVCNTDSSPTLTNVIISGNTANDSGGGMANVRSNPTLTNVIISGNIGSLGGGLENGHSSPTLTNVIISGNISDVGGGGMANTNSSPTLTNVIMSGNIGFNSGGIFNLTSSSQIRNSIIWGNQANGAPSNITNLDVTSTAVVSFSLIEGGYAGTGNLSADPQFVAAVPAAPSTGGNLRLQHSSPAIDAGSNALLPVNLTVDSDGNPRIADAPGSPGNAVDMGAYEIQPIIYVRAGASRLNTGSSWVDAYTSLQSGLNTAVSGDELWVAAGSYPPTTTTDRTASFTLKQGVALYGGFAGSETSRDQRDWMANLTTLSGEIGGGGSADNSYHVVIGAHGATLDGVTISGGNADGSASNALGGGIWNESSSPMIANVTITGNSAALYGGGMYNNLNSSPTLTNVTISGNRASLFGGGLANERNSNPTLTNVSISGNRAIQYGGGGMANYTSTPILTNVIISGNSADQGGGIYNESSAPTLTNVTISGNSATSDGGGVYNYISSSPQIRNSILWGNRIGTTPATITNDGTSSAMVSYSLVEGGYTGTSILNADPLFVSGVPFTPSSGGDLHLQKGSPAINAGSNIVTTPSLPGTDRDGSPRIVNTTVDLGAYERQVWITSAPPPASAIAGTSYSHSFTAVGLNTPAPLSFSITAGNLPPGLSLSADGRLSGVPTSAGTYSDLVVTARNSYGSDTQIFSIVVTALPLRYKVHLPIVIRG